MLFHFDFDKEDLIITELERESSQLETICKELKLETISKKQFPW